MGQQDTIRSLTIRPVETPLLIEVESVSEIPVALFSLVARRFKGLAIAAELE
ncbi:hypothetical protein [Notoacmeibacter ruber]|uniref:hypothetical protein n=1 Tax=Notoacmeibacter ruber TaxID=2670375 RepID=UPI001314D506|nr:hypothetical protein [Notoacmeibacter ruber]